MVRVCLCVGSVDVLGGWDCALCSSGQRPDVYDWGGFNMTRQPLLTVTLRYPLMANHFSTSLSIR